MVLVCHAHKFVFLKTSKTAGTSIEMTLEGLCSPPDHQITEKTLAVVSQYGIVGRRMIAKRKPLWFFRSQNLWAHHMPAKSVAKHLGQIKWDAYKKITIVRNPFDRAVSQFYWKMRRDPVRNAPFAKRQKAFRAFLTSELFKTDTEIVFIDNEFIIDHTIRFEQIPTDLRALSEKMNIPINLKNIVHTKSQASKRETSDISKYFGPDEREIVLDRMSWVFDRFDYSTDPNDACK